MEQDENKPLSVWQFLGYQLLFSIPCVGIICTIIFACGAVKNNNLKNWAKAMLILIGIVIALYVFLIVFGVATAMIAGTNGILSDTY